MHPILPHRTVVYTHDLNITGRPVAVAAALHICHGCVSATNPTGHRRMVTGVDLDRTPYLAERDGFQISSSHNTVPIPDTPGQFHTAMAGLLQRWHQQARATTVSADDIDEADRCRTPGCDGDPNDGEGWDGFCGNCADRNYASGS